jgi:hypothetical protein
VLPAPGPGIDPRSGDEAARRHFRVVACRADTLDWLLLDPAGHRRARFDFIDGGWRHRWITP